MKYTSKSIKTVLHNHQAEIYSYLQSKSQFKQLQECVQNILNSDELKGNQSVAEAKQILEKCSCNYNYYITTLVTYMTGMPISH